MSRMKLLLDVVSDLRSLADSFQALADAAGSDPGMDAAAGQRESGKEEAAGQKAAEEQKLTLEDIRAVLAEKSQNGMTAQVRELIIKYGASRLSDIDPSHYADLIREAEVLDGA